MSNINKVIQFLLLFILMTSCGTFSDAGKVLRNEKIKSTDEFLVKKREPLSLPPDYQNVQEPDSIREDKRNDEKSLKKILKVPEEEKPSINKSSGVEQSIIDKIRK